MTDPTAPRLDVVIVTFESAAHLDECLAALPGWCSVTVVDNASTDGSAGIAARHGARVIENTTNRGFAAAANQGASAGTAEYLLLLNPDAVVRETALRRLVDELTDDPLVGVVGPSLRRPDGTMQRAAWPFPTARASWLEAVGLLRRRDSRSAGFVIGACFLTRRELWTRLGGFDERYWLYGEEADYCRRVQLAGSTVRLVDDAEADHVGGASGPALGETTLEHFLRGTDHFVHKYEGPAALRSHRAALLVGSVVRLPLLFARHPSDERVTYRRRVIRRQLRVLRAHPGAVHRDTNALVVCSLEPWDDVWRRNQFLTRELVRRDPARRVLWVEPPFDVVHRIRSGVGERRRGMRRVESLPGVIRFQPVKWAPRRLGSFADRSLARQVRRAARRMGMSRPTLWINDSSFAGLAATTNWPALYDITDDWTLAADGAEKQRIVDNERRLFDRCREVVVCSPGLHASRSTQRAVTLIPNAVDAEHMVRPQPRPDDLPLGTTAVYIGTLHPLRVDLPLIEHLARTLPDVHVVLVGPDVLDAEGRATLRGLMNVHLLGPRPYDLVPGYLQHADVLIVPHAVNDFTESLDPIKAYELLASDRPVVATPAAGFRELSDEFVVAEGDAFVEAVRIAAHASARRSTDSIPTWEERAVAFDAALARTRTAHRPRVVYLGHTARASGGELALSRLLPALGGVDRHVILAEDGPMVARFAATGATVEVLPMSDRARDVRRDAIVPRRLPLGAVTDTARYVWRLRGRLREINPDLVHTNTLKSALYGVAAGKLAGTPVVWHVRDRIADDYLPRPAVRLVRIAARLLPDAIISNSATTMAALGRVRQVRSVVPSPVVFDSVAGRSELRSRESPVQRVGIVGRIAPWKGQNVFLHAFALAFPRGPEQAVIIGSPMFGEDEFETELRQLAVDLGIEGRVEFRGFRDDIPAELARLDVLVHASVLPEPFGQVVIEGMAAGLPVIASDEGGPAEVITHDIDGLLVRPGDPEALAAVLRTVADDAQLRRRLGERAVERSTAFSPERVAAQVLAVYEEMLGQ